MTELVSFLPLVAIALLFWLMVIRPASRRQKELARIQSALQVGQRVMLSSGIFGTVTGVVDDRVARRDRAGRRGRGRPPGHRLGRAGRRGRTPAPTPTARPEVARRPSPGRTLVVFFLGLALAYGLVAVAGVLDPQARARPPGRHPHHPDRPG